MSSYKNSSMNHGSMFQVWELDKAISRDGAGTLHFTHHNCQLHIHTPLCEYDPEAVEVWPQSPRVLCGWGKCDQAERTWEALGKTELEDTQFYLYCMCSTCTTGSVKFANSAVLFGALRKIKHVPGTGDSRCQCVWSHTSRSSRIPHRVEGAIHGEGSQVGIATLQSIPANGTEKHESESLLVPSSK